MNKLIYGAIILLFSISLGFASEWKKVYVMIYDVSPLSEIIVNDVGTTLYTSEDGNYIFGGDIKTKYLNYDLSIVVGEYEGILDSTLFIGNDIVIHCRGNSKTYRITCTN